MSTSQSWTDVENADGYTIYFRNATNETLYELTTKELSISVPSDAVTENGDYYFLVVAFGAGYDQSEGSAGVAVSDRLPGPVILTPVEDEVCTSLSTMLTWEEVSGSGGYVVSLARKTDRVDEYGQPVYEKVWSAPNDTVNVGDTLSYELTGLVYGEHYRAAVGTITVLDDGSERIGWTERLFCVAMPELSVTLIADNQTPYEKQQLTLTALSSHALTQAVLTDEAGVAVNVTSSSSKETEGGREFTFVLSEAKQCRKTYTVTVSGVNEMAAVQPAIASVEVEWLDANAPAVNAVTMDPANAWPDMDVTFTITANANTTKLDVYWVNNGEASLMTTLTPVSSTAETVTFQYVRRFETDGDYAMQFTPLNADNEWSDGYPFACTILPKGKLPAPAVTNLVKGDSVPHAGYTVKWDPITLGDGMFFGGYSVTVYSWDETTAWWKAMPGYYNVNVGLDCQYALPAMTEGRPYRIEVYAMAEGETIPSEELSGCTAIDFVYRSVPGFKQTEVETTGIVGEQVTVRWNAPAWRLDPALKPDSYVVWWYGPGIENGYAVQVPGTDTECVLDGRRILQGGQYSVNVYALLSQSQAMAQGENAFTILTPQVNISYAQAKDNQLTNKMIYLEGNVENGVRAIAVQLLENDIPVAFGSGSYHGKRLVLDVPSEAFEETLEMDTVNADSIYKIRVDGYMSAEDAANDLRAVAVASKNVAAHDGKITKILLNGANAIDAQRYHFAGKVQYSVYTNGKAEYIQYTIDGAKDTFTFGIQMEDGSWRYDIQLNIAEGIHTLTFASNKDTSVYKTHLASVNDVVDETAYAGKNGVELKLWPTSNTPVYKKLKTGTTILLRGMCDGYAYVKVNGVNCFADVDNLVFVQGQTDYRITSPKDGTAMNLARGQYLEVKWTACAEAAYYEVILRDAETKTILLQKTVDALQSKKAAQDEMEKLYAEIAGMQGPHMNTPDEVVRFTAEDFGENFDWSVIYNVSIEVIPYGE